MKLTKEVVKEISTIKDEDEYMREFRLNSLNKFFELPLPNFGPKIEVDFDSINYYKKREDNLTNNWDNVSCEVRKLFNNLGVIDAEKKYLDGSGAQYDSEVIYHNMIKELEDKHVIFLDTDSAYRQYPELF